MNIPSLVCPNCRKRIRLTDTATASALSEVRRKLEADVNSKVKAELRARVETRVEIRLRQELAKARKKAHREADDLLSQKVSERDAQIAGLRRQIEYLRRKASQGSEQTQGDAFERDMATLLRQHFPKDDINHIGKGRAGADFLQHIRSPNGQLCGTLVWECKRTRSFQPRWLAKLRSDLRSHKADAALLVSTALPPKVETFALVDHVWLTGPRFALPLATLIRQTLIDLVGLRSAVASQRTNSDLVYRYLTGPRFHQHIETVIEIFVDMKAELDRERRVAFRAWAKRDTQLTAVLSNTAAFYGDLQAIAGTTLKEVRGLIAAETENPVKCSPESKLQTEASLSNE